ncbi:MAG: hypothetical protein JWL65_5894 [Gammaproteobacteria bacterium]|nr:hypothetical protein [Gammaproteobacteria bacterium]
MDKCYACGKPFRDPNRQRHAFLEDDDYASVAVGPDCFRHIVKSGEIGYKPARGGPRLFVERHFAQAASSINETAKVTQFVLVDPYGGILTACGAWMRPPFRPDLLIKPRLFESRSAARKILANGSFPKAGYKTREW